jgi:enoyl-CoA hydratase/carnithine racemase
MTETAAFAFPVRRDGAIARIDLGRPDEGNMPTRSMIADLGALIARTGSDTSVHVVVLEGRGPSFCRGRDGRGESAAGLSPLDMRRKLYAPVLDAYAAISDSPVPVVALVHGDAVGFGAALATACDVTLASDRARFSFPEIEHNIPPTLAISGVMSKVPQKALTYLVYSAESVSAAEAAALGIASVVFPAAEFPARSEAFLAKLAGRPRIVLETIKRYQAKAPGLSPDMAAEYAGTIMVLARTHK